jgi:hypothetical protein
MTPYEPRVARAARDDHPGHRGHHANVNPRTEVSDPSDDDDAGDGHRVPMTYMVNARQFVLAVGASGVPARVACAVTVGQRCPSGVR